MLRLPGSNLVLKFEHRFLRALETELVERDIDVDEYLKRYRLNAATRLIQIGRRWEDPDITEAQADQLLDQVKAEGVSFGTLFVALIRAFSGADVPELERDNLAAPADVGAADAAPAEDAPKKTGAVGLVAASSRRRSA